MRVRHKTKPRSSWFNMSKLLSVSSLKISPEFDIFHWNKLKIIDSFHHSLIPKIIELRNLSPSQYLSMLPNDL